MSDLIHRDILDLITPWLGEKEILVLLGSRQVGKTSILRLLQDYLKDEPVFYFDLESTFDLTYTASPEHFVEYLASQGMSTERRTWDKHEVDFIVARSRSHLLPVEVKYKTMSQPKIPPALKNFMRLYDCHAGVVLTRDYMDMAEEGAKKVYFIPAWMA